MISQNIIAGIVAMLAFTGITGPTVVVVLKAVMLGMLLMFGITFLIVFGISRSLVKAAVYGLCSTSAIYVTISTGLSVLLCIGFIFS
jgi:tryptophan-rich sensory protein